MVRSVRLAVRTSFCPAAASVPPSTAPATFVEALLSWTAYRSYVAVSADRAIIALGAPAEVVEALPADSVSVIAFFSEGAALKSRSNVPAQRLPTTSTSAANAGHDGAPEGPSCAVFHEFHPALLPFYGGAPAGFKSGGHVLRLVQAAERLLQGAVGFLLP